MTDLIQHYPLNYLKAFLSESSWLPKVRDKGTRTQLFNDVPYSAGFYLNLLGIRAFNRTAGRRMFRDIPTLQNEPVL